MAVNIDEFKRDLESLKSQRSVLQAKLDGANKHIAELNATLAGMGFNSLEDAKAAYIKQRDEADAQHAQVKQLIAEINQVDSKCLTREEVMERLSLLVAKTGQTAPQQAPVQAHTEIPASIPVQPIPAPQQAVTQPQPVQSQPQPVQQPLSMFSEEPVADINSVAKPIPQALVDQDVKLNNSSDQGINNSDDLGKMLFASL